MLGKLFAVGFIRHTCFSCIFPIGDWKGFLLVGLQLRFRGRSNVVFLHAQLANHLPSYILNRLSCQPLKKIHDCPLRGQSSGLIFVLLHDMLRKEFLPALLKGF